jgi:FkbM family methyltransferase
MAAGKPRNRFTQIALGALIVLLLGYTLTLTLLFFFPGLAILPFASRTKNSPFCSTWKAVADAGIKVKQAKLAKEIRARSKALRSEGGYKLWATPIREYWVPDTSDEIISILLAQQKRNVYGDSQNGGVRSGDIVLDGGAHVGTYVQTALDAGAAKVIAIEPSPEALECLRRNFPREVESGRVVIYPKGIWDEEKRLVFYSNGNGAAGDSFVEHDDQSKVVGEIDVTTIDRIVSELGLPRVDIIKADIKGAGTRMVVGAANTIRAFHPRIVVSVEEAPENPQSIRTAVLQIAPTYQFRCGPCFYTGDEIRNDTVFFW